MSKSGGKFKKTKKSFERTLAMIKPEVIEREVEIVSEIHKAGFVVLKRKCVSLTPEQVSDYYGDAYEASGLNEVIEVMCAGPLCAMVLGGEDAVKRWKRVLGPENPIQARLCDPKCFRARFGIDERRNALEGSVNHPRACSEIRFFFPDVILEPLPSRLEAVGYMMQKVHPTLVKGMAALCHAKPANQIVWLADWLMMNNPNKPVVEQIQTM